ncbi:MAG: hypothetical protein JNL60_14420 [Bacteroidia bacterium]|nr:hypothetical protein [Bacteroidia bacterium]
MLLLLSILTITISLAGLIVYFQNKRKQRRKDLYPLQVKVLSELLREMRTNKLSLHVVQNAEPKEVGSITVSEVAQSLDASGEFSKEKYDDHKLFIAKGAEPLPGLSKYIGNGILPKDIRSELKDFQSTKFEKVSIGNTPCFVLAPNGQRLMSNEVLLQGNADAFESWLTFRERANNIEYMVQQWVAENSPQELDSKKFMNTKVLEA